MEVNCSAGYEERSGGCVTIPTAGTSPVQLIAGVTVGVFAILAFIGVLCYFAKNPHKFRQLLVSFLLNEVAIAASICLEIWDMFGDGYLFFSVLNADANTKQNLGSTIVILWVIFFCIATAVSITCFGLKIHAGILVFRRRQSEFKLGESELDAYTEKHRKLLLDCQKSIKLIAANLLVGCLEDAPFGVLGLLYLLKMSQTGSGHSNLLQMLSVASSFLMLGIKCSKLPQLKALLDSASKQQRKCKRMVLGPSAEDLKKWLASFQQFKVLIPKFDGMTGTQMLEMYDDEPLKQLGLYSEVDRKYLLLQIARVREHAKIAAGRTPIRLAASSIELENVLPGDDRLARATSTDTERAVC
jgi:hypothetical protein